MSKDRIVGFRELTLGILATTALIALPARAKPPARPAAPILRSLPSEAQELVEKVRESCPSEDNYVTKGDEGLLTFTVSGAQAVLVDELRFCGTGFECMHSVNCATGFMHSVAIYVRSGGSWKKSLSTFASEPILLSLEYRTEKFKALLLKVFPGDWGCPEGTDWRDTCPAVVKWDGKSFVHNLL
jgi:hypothetical protein